MLVWLGIRGEMVSLFLFPNGIRGVKEIAMGWVWVWGPILIKLFLLLSLYHFFTEFYDAIY